ncbi:WEE1-like kinase [Perilla frutescens var. frutescens]|nr:WEE1-like kinase [Perilla frutescens var. frutescens]
MTGLYNFLMLDLHCHPDVDLKTSLDSTDLSYQLLEDLGKDASGTDEMKTGKPVELQNSCGFNPAGIGGDGLSRYRTDFHEIEKIVDGNFNQVFKVLKKIDGCMYAVKFMYTHSRRIAHLDVKPDNIYVKEGVYKLGDFGCATLIDKSLPVEEGDARYMPREILNENYDNLDRVDIFSLGASIYELEKIGSSFSPS